MFDFVERNDLVVLNDPNQMTRHVVSTGYSDLIDYIIVSRQVSSRFKECYSGECIGSDHLPIHLKLQLACQIDKVPTKQVRILAKCDWTLFNDSLIEVNNHYRTNALDSEVAIDARCD